MTSTIATSVLFLLAVIVCCSGHEAAPNDHECVNNFCKVECSVGFKFQDGCHIFQCTQNGEASKKSKTNRGKPKTDCQKDTNKCTKVEVKERFEKHISHCEAQKPLTCANLKANVCQKEVCAGVPFKDGCQKCLCKKEGSPTCTEMADCPDNIPEGDLQQCEDRENHILAKCTKMKRGGSRKSKKHGEKKKNKENNKRGKGKKGTEKKGKGKKGTEKKGKGKKGKGKKGNQKKGKGKKGNQKKGKGKKEKNGQGRSKKRGGTNIRDNIEE